MQYFHISDQEKQKVYEFRKYMWSNGAHLFYVFKRQAKLFNRRREKILTTIVSQFSAMYVFYWPQFMKTPLKYPPSFDGRIVVYPTYQVGD